MGSFNETCVLSGLPVVPGDRVRLLLIAENPYAETDSREATRGVYPSDNWFCRTPPLAGEYADYGRTALDPVPAVDLVAALLSVDAVRRPRGDNPYHDPPVQAGRPLAHYLEAAWEGRLQVWDRRPADPPPHWPTPDRVEVRLRDARLRLQADGHKSGYTYVPVRPGVVAVHVGGFGDARRRLDKAKAALVKAYACRLVSLAPDSTYETCLIVAPKGAFAAPERLADTAAIRRDLTTHPRAAVVTRPRAVSVLTVVVREDVWRVYRDVPVTPGWGEKRWITAKTLEAALRKTYDAQEEYERKTAAAVGGDELAAAIRRLSDATLDADVFPAVGGQTGPAAHLWHSARTSFPDKDGLLAACGELAKVLLVMARLNRPWFVPCLGGQETHWDLHRRVLSGLAAVTRKEWANESTGV